MNLKKNNGFTQIDIIISIIIVVIFVSIIAGLFGNLANEHKEIKRKAEATNIAIKVIETIKAIEYTEIDSSIISLEELNNLIDEPITPKSGYTVEINVKNYKDYEENVGKDIEDLIKKVKVTVKYTLGKLDKKVELETLISSI